MGKRAADVMSLMLYQIAQENVQCSRMVTLSIHNILHPVATSSPHLIYSHIILRRLHVY